jgi:hypothetical protein
MIAGLAAHREFDTEIGVESVFRFDHGERQL